jgi:hypothetical protein
MHYSIHTSKLMDSVRIFAIATIVYASKVSKVKLECEDDLMLLQLKVDVRHKNCTWYKIMTMTFWRNWWLPTRLNPKPIISYWRDWWL